MKRLIISVALVGSACAGARLDTRAVLHRWENAMGGHAALVRVTNTWTRLSRESASGSGVVEEWVTATGRRKQIEHTFGGRKEVRVFDGTHGWVSEGGPARPLSQRELEVARTPAYLGSFSQFFSDRMPGVIAYAGVDETGLYHVLRIQPRDARASTMYLDARTFLPVRHVQELLETELVVEFDGWKNIDGVRFPARLKLSTADGTYQATETLVEARTNRVLEADAFARPSESSRGYRLTAGVAAIPFEEDQGQLWIEGRIGDSPPIAIGIDTGAAVTVIDRAMAETLGLRIESSGGVGGAGGVVESGRVANVDLRLGGAELDDLTMHAIDLAPIAARSGRAMSMILGYDLFSRFVVEIDYDARELRLHDAESWVAPSFMKPVPIEIEGNNPYVRVTATIGGIRESGLFVIDSGGSSTVIFMPSFVRERNLLDRVSPVLKSRAGGVGGEFPLYVGRIDELTMGDFTIRKPIAMLPASGELAAPGSAGNLGGALLRRFRVAFDYSRGQMLLSPSRNFDAADEFDMSGVALVAENGLTRVRVVRVREESPGAEAGLRAGDELMSVDGIAASDLGIRAINARFRRPDREHRLRIRRGGQEIEITLRTRRLI